MSVVDVMKVQGSCEEVRLKLGSRNSVRQGNLTWIVTLLACWFGWNTLLLDGTSHTTFLHYSKVGYEFL